MINFKNVDLGYKNKTILKNINIEIEKGKITTLLGPNGSGKTTFLSSINKTNKHLNGQIFLNNKDISKFIYKELSKYIATVQQINRSTFDFTVFDIILMGRTPYINYNPKKIDFEKTEETIEKMNIQHLKNDIVNNLSGGERQLVMISRAINQNTEIIILDEPTSYLDLKNQINVIKIIKKINKEQGVTFIITLHDPNQAIMLSDNVIFFNNGKVETGPKQDLITKEQINQVYDIESNMVEVNGSNYIIPKIS